MRTLLLITNCIVLIKIYGYITIMFDIDKAIKYIILLPTRYLYVQFFRYIISYDNCSID